MDLATQRTNLVNAVTDANLGLQVTPLTDAPDTPCVMFYPHTPFEWRTTFEDGSAPRFCALILVPYTDTEPAQDQLDAFIISVAAAVQTVTNASVEALSEYTPVEHTDGTRSLTAELIIGFVL